MELETEKLKTIRISELEDNDKRTELLMGIIGPNPSARSASSGVSDALAQSLGASIAHEINEKVINDRYQSALLAIRNKAGRLRIQRKGIRLEINMKRSVFIFNWNYYVRILNRQIEKEN